MTIEREDLRFREAVYRLADQQQVNPENQTVKINNPFSNFMVKCQIRVMKRHLRKSEGQTTTQLLDFALTLFIISEKMK